MALRLQDGALLYNPNLSVIRSIRERARILFLVVGTNGGAGCTLVFVELDVGLAGREKIERKEQHEAFLHGPPR